MILQMALSALIFYLAMQVFRWLGLGTVLLLLLVGLGVWYFTRGNPGAFQQWKARAQNAGSTVQRRTAERRFQRDVNGQPLSPEERRAFENLTRDYHSPGSTGGAPRA